MADHGASDLLYITLRAAQYAVFTSKSVMPLLRASATTATVWLEFMRRESPVLSGNVGSQRLSVCCAMVTNERIMSRSFSASSSTRSGCAAR